MLRNRARSAQSRQTGAIRLWIQERAFSTLYGPAASVYDFFTRWLFLGEWERWQQTVLPLIPSSGLTVEIGSGTGQLARIGTTPDRCWIGIERSPSMLRVARRRAGQYGPHLVRADATSLPIRTNAAAAVVATFPTRFIVDPHTASEIRRVLSPGGALIVVLDGELAAHGLRRRLRRLGLRAFYGRPSANVEADWSLAGISGHRVMISTAHGKAQLFVGYHSADVTN